MIEHSWVRRLAELDLPECEGFRYICKGGATFVNIRGQVEQYFVANPSRPKPLRIFVFLGSNDLDVIPGTAEVYLVTRECENLSNLLRRLCPGAEIIFAQVEDRYDFNHCENPDTVRREFKAKANKFNKWMNLWKGKDHLFILKGRKGFSDPELYARDGVHLNYQGNLKLAQRIADFSR